MKAKKQKSSLLQFIFIIIISGLLGGIVGFSIQFGQGNLMNVLDALESFLGKNLLWLQISSFTVISFIVIFLLLRSKKLIAQSNEEDYSILEKAETYTSTATVLCAINYMLQFLWFFSIVYFGFHTETNFNQTMIGIILFIVAVFVNLYFEISSIKVTKQLNPSLKGDPLKFNFEKEYIESCDEAEKHIIYMSSYKTFKILKNCFIVAMVVLIILQTVINIGFTAPLMVAILWGIHSITFSVAAHNATKAKK